MSLENGDKKPLDGPSASGRKKIVSKNILSWLLAVLLVLLLIVVSIQFLYPIVTCQYEDGENETVPTSADFEDLDFTINPKRLCTSTEDVQLLVAVASDAKHVERRAAIRDTWGSIANTSHHHMRLAFVVGETQDPKLTAALCEESFLFHDIIQGPAGTPKSVAMLKWVAQYCSHAHYFLKAEDDTFVNLEVVAELLGRKPFNTHPKFIGGHVVQTATTTAKPCEGDDCDNQEYISGSVYISRGPTAMELYQASMDLLPLTGMMESYLEDAFVTGMVGKNVGVSLVHEPLFGLQPCSPKSCGSFASAPGLSPPEMQVLWSQLQGTSGGYMFQEADQIDVGENKNMPSLFDLMFNTLGKYEDGKGKEIQEPNQDALFRIVIKDDGGEADSSSENSSHKNIDDALNVEPLPQPMSFIMLN